MAPHCPDRQHLVSADGLERLITELNMTKKRKSAPAGR
jgi:hypothetical protein